MNYTGPQAMLAEIERLRIIVADYHDLQHRSNAIDDENGRLRAALGSASAKLKLLYMAAGLGRKTGREALAALNDEITKIDGALEQKTE